MVFSAFNYEGFVCLFDSKEMVMSYKQLEKNDSWKT